MTLEEISTGAIAELIEKEEDGVSYPTLTKYVQCSWLVDRPGECGPENYGCWLRLVFWQLV